MLADTFSSLALGDVADATWTEIRTYQGALDYLREVAVSPGAAAVGRRLESDPRLEMAVRDFVCRFYASQVARDLRKTG